MILVTQWHSESHPWVPLVVENGAMYEFMYILNIFSNISVQMKQGTTRASGVHNTDFCMDIQVFMVSLARGTFQCFHKKPV